tara:strand:- start:217 stop:423 length:207 start_codon:yes stop_codon:yes gene_type:complete
MMRSLGFEELMDIAFKARKKKDKEKLNEIKEEFDYRVNKRMKMGKKPMKTSLAGQEQTTKWIHELKNK